MGATMTLVGLVIGISIFILPGTLVMSVLFTTVYSGIALNTDLTKGVVDRFRSLPIWKPSPLVGSLLGDSVRYVVAGTVIVVLGLLLAACGGDEDEEGAEKGRTAKDTLVVAVHSDMQNLDVHTSSADEVTNIILTNLYDLPITFKKGTAEPVEVEGGIEVPVGDPNEFEAMAAESWEWNDDMTEITFTLREGLKFPDGSPITAETFNYVLDQRALDRARMLDGKLLLVTNMADHEPQQIVERYRALADIERGFRVLKSDIEIAPVYHRLPDRIRAHALICFLALVLYRVLRLRLKASDHPLSPTRALELARKIQFHQVTLHRRETASGLTKLKPEQRDLFEAIGLPAPAASCL